MGILCLPFYSNAQSEDSLTSKYIKSYKDKFFLWPVFKRRSLSFQFDDPGSSGNSIVFRPNNSYGLGVGVYMFDLAVEFVFNVPLDVQKESNYGTTSAQDIQLNIVSKAWGADVIYQRYNGFYLSNPDGAISPTGAYPQRPDFQTENYGVSGIYIFNHRKFSLRSAFTFADRQLKSSGSFVLGAAYNSFHLSADSSILNAHYSAKVGITQSVKRINYETFSVAPGYAYNFIWNNFYVSGQLLAGPAIQLLGYEGRAGEKNAETKLNTFASLRLAVGYSTDRFFTGFTFASQVRNVKFENIQFSNTSSTMRILVGWRFQEFGFLRKSVWDLLPPWGKKK